MSAPAVDLSLTIGALFAGVTLASIFYGVTCSQTLFYYLAYPKDSKIFKFMVFYVWTLDTVHEILLCLEMWSVIAYGNPFTPAAVIELFFSCGVSTMVQMFFLWRIWVLDSRLWPIVVILLVSVWAYVGIIFAYGGKAFVMGLDNFPTNPTMIQLTLAGNGITAAVDVIIAATLIIFFVRGRSDISEATNKMLLRLMVMTVNTGCWTAVFALAIVAMEANSFTANNSLLYAAFFYPICKLYSNTFLGTLNARNYIRKGSWKLEQSLNGSAPTQPSHNTPSRGTNRGVAGPMLISMNTQIRTDEDNESFELNSRKSQTEGRV